MGIDRIGKGGAQPPVAPTHGDVSAPRVADPSRTFRVEPSKTETAAPLVPSTETPLDRLRSGEVDIHGYLDLKVEEATTHLSGLPTAELGEIRKMLRDQLATDPMLAELVQHATGRPPTPPEDE